MCGIYGYVGEKNAFEQVQAGLELLQYRGYDSCGIAAFNKSQFKINKAVGVLKNLKKPTFNSHIAFGHTRWATHGAVNEINAHPHYSIDHAFTVVHNGIINNAQEIKTMLEEKGIKFYSQTDTEVIANLLYVLNGTVEERIKKSLNILQGSFALIIGTKDGVLYLVKRFSPLNLLKVDKEIRVSSDKASLPSGELYTLHDEDVIKINNSEITAINGELKFEVYTNNIERLNKGNYQHYMIKEINETPTSIYNTYQNICDIDFKKIFKGKKRLIFIGCGTAYHSCLVGEYLFKIKGGFETENCLASNYIRPETITKQQLFIIVSQSGETADCIKVAEQIKAKGGQILLITNEGKSTLTRFATYCICTKAEKEIAVASTKTYSCQVFVFEYMINRLTNDKYTLNIKKLVENLTYHLKNINIDNLVRRFKQSDKLIMIGKDFDYLILQEASLKIREIDYYFTIPMYAGELKHGTLSLVDEGTTVMALNTSQDKNALNTAISEIVSRKGQVVNIEDYVPIDISQQDFKAIYAILPFQLLSYKLAVELDHNPDMPKNLAKSVTVE